MATNNYLTFCPTDTGTNLLSQVDYAAATDRTNGNQPGVASSKLVNKAIRQSAFVTSQIAQAISDLLGLDMLDDGNAATLLTNIKSGLLLTSIAYAAKTANYTLLVTDGAIAADSSGGTFTLTLPTAVGYAGKIFHMKKTDSSFTQISLATTSSQTIDGAAASTYKLSTQGEEYMLQSNGANWIILNHYVPSYWQTYSLTIGATTTPPTKGTTSADIAQWKRVGDTIQMRYTLVQTGAGSAGSGQYLFPVPTGLTIDTSKTPGFGVGRAAAVGGYGAVSSNGTDSYSSQVVVVNSTNFGLYTVYGTGSSDALGSGAIPLSGASTRYSFFAEAIISGWNG